MVDEILEAKKQEDDDEILRIVPLPKIVFFYPTALVSLICGIMMSMNSAPLDALPNHVVFAGWFFMAVFTANVMIISFDFPGIKFLAVMFAAIAAILGLALAAVYFPTLIPGIADFVKSIKPVAMSQFYYFMSFVLWATIIAAWSFSQFTNVWYLRSNELVHKKGILGDVEKYPTINLRVTKEITDLFEFCLLMSGSLVLRPSTTDRPIVLENVVRINHKEKRIRELLAKWKVGA